MEKVSIIIPTYKRAKLLKETLHSVMNQSYQNWECIIVNDGEDQETCELVKSFQDNDDRFIFFDRPDNIKKGAASCRNFGFSKSSGKYIQWLDDDDLLSSDKLERQVSFIEKRNLYNIFVACDWDYLWPGKKYSPVRIIEDEFLTPENFFTQLRTKLSFMPPHAYLTPKNLVLEAGLWNTDLLINQDAEFFTRVLLNSEKLFHVDDCHVLYRIHDSERISERYGDKIYDSLIYSLRLIHAHLLVKNIRCKAYFKWKLLKLVIPNWGNSAKVFKKHTNFLKEIGINLNYITFYRIKYFVYIRVMPRYKKLIKSK